MTSFFPSKDDYRPLADAAESRKGTGVRTTLKERDNATKMPWCSTLAFGDFREQNISCGSKPASRFGARMFPSAGCGHVFEKGPVGQAAPFRFRLRAYANLAGPVERGASGALSLTLANSEQAYRPRGMRNMGSLSTIS
jgi:hypothetical protein